MRILVSSICVFLMQQGQRTMLACALTYSFCVERRKGLCHGNNTGSFLYNASDIDFLALFFPTDQSPLIVTIFSLVHPCPPKLVFCATCKYMRVTLGF